MSIPILTVATDPQRTQDLIKSASKHGWELHLIQPDEWKGFGTKLIETYNYLKEHEEIERFVFCDAFDVVVLGGEYEFEKKRPVGWSFVCSAERGCWPDSELESAYTKYEHGFNFLNSGLYYATRKAFMWYMECSKPEYHTDDQAWMTQRFLMNSDICLDNEQKVFNSHSFIKDGEYTYNNNRVQINGNEPCFIHFNGRSVDDEFNKNITI